MKDEMTQNADRGLTLGKGVKVLCTISNFNFPIIWNYIQRKQLKIRVCACCIREQEDQSLAKEHHNYVTSDRKFMAAVPNHMERIFHPHPVARAVMHSPQNCEMNQWCHAWKEPSCQPSWQEPSWLRHGSEVRIILVSLWAGPRNLPAILYCAGECGSGLPTFSDNFDASCMLTQRPHYDFLLPAGSFSPGKRQSQSRP